MYIRMVHFTIFPYASAPAIKKLYLFRSIMKVIDKTETPRVNYLKIFAFRNDETRAIVGIFRWVFLSFLEVLFGDELLENLVTTASVKSLNKRYVSDSHGNALHLSHHIPDGIFNNMARMWLIEVLYFKYYLQYTLIEPMEEPEIQKSGVVVDCTHVRFAVFKPKLWQIISFRRVYILCWLIINLAVDLSVYLVSNNITLAVLSAVVVEAVRRLFKV